MGEGNGKGKAPVIGLWNECVPEKRPWCRGSLLVYDPSGFFKILDPDVFPGRRRFFSESGGKFCRTEVRHFFEPKGGSRFIYVFLIVVLCINNIPLPLVRGTETLRSRRPVAN